MGLSTVVETTRKYQTSCNYICSHSTKAQERDLQAAPWLCPKPHKYRPPLGPAFHSGLTAAAHRAISDLFPELLWDCSCFDAQRSSKSHCGAKDIAFPAPRFYEIASPTALPHSDRMDVRWSRSMSYSPIPGLSSEAQSQSESSVLTGLSSSADPEEGDALYRCAKREVSLDRYSTSPTPSRFKAPSPSGLGVEEVWFLW